MYCFMFGSRVVVFVYSICFFYVEVVDVTHDSIDNNRKTTFSTISVLRFFFCIIQVLFSMYLGWIVCFVMHKFFFLAFLSLLKMLCCV